MYSVSTAASALPLTKQLSSYPNDEVGQMASVTPGSLCDTPVLCLAESRWQSGIGGRHHLPREFSRRNDVCYVNPPVHVRDVFSVRADSGQTQSQPTIIEFPPWLSRVYRPWLEKRLQRSRISYLRRLLRKRWGKPPVILAFHPRIWPFVEALPESPLFYFPFDAFGDYLYQGVARTATAYCDAQLAKRAKAIFTVTDSIASSYSDQAAPVRVLPNGVDYSAFSAAWNEPDELRAVPHPRLCMVGKLNSQLNYRLLLDVVNVVDASFVVVGAIQPMSDVETELARRFLQHDRVFHVGAKPHSQVPAYVSNCDLGICPYSRNPVTLAGSSLKLMEYFAAGKPVVAVRLPSMESFKDMITFAESADEWRQNISVALKDDSSDKISNRQRTAKRLSWQAQSELVGADIVAALQGCNLKWQA